MAKAASKKASSASTADRTPEEKKKALETAISQLEKNFGNAAYATIRGFVLKFEKLGLLCSAKYGTRIKYKIFTD